VKLYTKKDHFKQILSAKLEFDNPELEIGRLKTAIFRMITEYKKLLESETDIRITKLYQKEIELFEGMYEALESKHELLLEENE